MSEIIDLIDSCSESDAEKEDFGLSIVRPRRNKNIENDIEHDKNDCYIDDSNQELNSKLSRLDITNDSESAKSNEVRTKKVLLSFKKVNVKRSLMYRYRETDSSDDDSSDDDHSSVGDESSMSHNRENEDDNVFAQSTASGGGKKLVSKVNASKSQTNNCFDLVDTSDDEGGEEQSEGEEGEEIGNRNTRNGNISRRFHQQQQQNHISLDDTKSLSGKENESDYSDIESIASSCSNSKSNSSHSSTSSSVSKEIETKSNWEKIKLNNAYLYTLPGTVLTPDSNGNQRRQEIHHPEIYLPSKLFRKLFEHQRIGVEWIASLHAKGIGGILGDDMGLGKTMQTLSLLGGLMMSKQIKNALIVCPKSLLLNWEREAIDVLINHCMLRANIIVLDSSMRQDKRERILKQALKCSTSRPHLVITTYGLVKSSMKQFVGGRSDGSYYWDYCILDEGHQIKNSSTEQHKSCSRICRSTNTRRLLLTGTPIQNNMKEMWSLFDWASSGRLLGPLKRFQNQFATPIENGRNKSASEWELKTAEKANQRLQHILRPHFLQRMKNEEFSKCLPEKKDYVVWTHLSDTQRYLYERYIDDSGKVAAVLCGDTRSPLEAITYLKKLCDHPDLVSNTKQALNATIRESGKLDTLVNLVENLHNEGHKCLIFSPSTKILDIIQGVLSSKLVVARIDGSTNGKLRQSIVDDFNKEGSDKNALLLSTKAAGCGLNLTAADRVIIFSPSWNPADDSQAVDRCYRIGQTKDVDVFRFITAGTVEERMYERQVHKDGIRRTLTTNSGCATERHFNQDDLRKMFTLKSKGICDLLENIGRVEISISKFAQVVGVSSHDLVYCRQIIDVDVPPIKSPFLGRIPKQLSNSALVASDLISKLNNITLDSRDSNQPNSDGAKGSNHLLHKESKKSHFENISEEKQLSFHGKENYNNVLLHKRKHTTILDTMFRNVDDLTNDGKFEVALAILIKSLECEELQGEQKLLVHKMISSRAIVHLQWHCV